MFHVYLFIHVGTNCAGRFCVPPCVVLLLHLVVDTPIDGIIVDSEEPIYVVRAFWIIQHEKCELLISCRFDSKVLLLLLLSMNLEDYSDS